MIKIQKLVKTFGHRVVLRRLDLSIEEGDFVTLLGANGAGKTTLLHLVASLSKPTAGDILSTGTVWRTRPASCAVLLGWFRTAPYCMMI